jgi:hypothetical protein
MLNLITEELLIDFWKLIGSHSSKNLASAVWETLELCIWVSRVHKYIIVFPRSQPLLIAASMMVVLMQMKMMKVIKRMKILNLQ